MSKENINIWGKPGCELPNGDLCDACCKLKGIQDPFFENGVKEIGVLCPLMKRKMGNDKGCGVHGFAPKSCQSYHCSQDFNSPGVQARLISTAYREGQVSYEVAHNALAFWPGRKALIGQKPLEE